MNNETINYLLELSLEQDELINRWELMSDDEYQHDMKKVWVALHVFKDNLSDISDDINCKIQNFLTDLINSREYIGKRKCIMNRDKTINNLIK